MPAITHESVALYAIGALDEPDCPPFKAHLADCDRCRADLVSFTAVVNALALAVSPAQPPPSLRARVIEEARRCPPGLDRRTRVLRALIALAMLAILGVILYGVIAASG